MKQQLELAGKLRGLSELIHSTAAQNILDGAASMLEENARLVTLAAHPECPEGLGFGGTLAWHRNKIEKLRQRPQA